MGRQPQGKKINKAGNNKKPNTSTTHVTVEAELVPDSEPVQVNAVNINDSSDAISELGASIADGSTTVASSVQSKGNKICYKHEKDKGLVSGLTKTFESFDAAKQCVFEYVKQTGIQLYIRTSKKFILCFWLFKL